MRGVAVKPSFDPLLVEVPEQFETARLLIRRPHPGDGAQLNAAILESLGELCPWMPWAQEAPSPQDSEGNIRRACARWMERSDLRLLAFARESGELIVNSGLHRIDWQVPKFEIGYWCRTSYCGQGYATETVRGIASFAFEQLNARRVEIRCDAHNQRSAAVARNAGFAREARLSNDSRALDGTLRDTLIFALTRPDTIQIHENLRPS